MMKLGSEERRKKNTPGATHTQIREQKFGEKGTSQAKNKTCSDQLQRILHGQAQQEKVKAGCASFSEKLQYKRTLKRIRVLYLLAPVLYRRNWQTLEVEFLANNNSTLKEKLMMNIHMTMTTTSAIIMYSSNRQDWYLLDHSYIHYNNKMELEFNFPQIFIQGRHPSNLRSKAYLVMISKCNDHTPELISLFIKDFIYLLI